MNQLQPMPQGDPGFQLAGPAPDHSAPAASFKVKKFLVYLRKLWWIPLITVTLGMGAGIVQFFWTPPIFVSRSTMVETEKLHLPDGAAFVEDPQSYFGTLSAVLGGELMKNHALKHLTDSGTNNFFTYDRFGAPVFNDGKPVDVQVSVGQAPKSDLFMLSASSSNPGFTPAFLDALMDEYLLFKKNARNGVSGGTLNSLSVQVEQQDRILKADQDALTDYERTTNLAVLEQELTVASGYLAKLKTELSDYQLQAKMLDAVALERDSSLPDTTNATESLLNSLGNAGPASELSPASANQGAEREIILLKMQRDKLAKYLRPEHPKMIKLDADIERSQKIIDLFHQQNRDQIVTARESLEIKMASVEKSVQIWEAKVAEDSAGVATADKYKVQISRDQSMYDRLVSLQQNIDISQHLDQETLTVMDQASPATRSYKKAVTNIAMATFGGLAMGLGIIFLFAARDDHFASLVEVTDRFGDYVVGQVPEIPGQTGSVPLALLERNDDRHIYAESYRNLRSALLYLAVAGERPKVLLITSAVPNEGKSTIAANLARTIALGGSNVILIDADMRRGHLHDLLGLPSQPGLSEMLSQPAELDNFIQRNSLANFAFIARGGIVPDPGDLFLGSAFNEILARLRQQYEYVIFDSSPVFASDDAATLAPQMDGTLFVVRSNYSSARVVTEALELLNQRQVKVLGLVYNRANTSTHSYKYYKYSEYYPPATPA